MEPFSPSSRSDTTTTTVTGSYSEYDTNTTATESDITSYSEYDSNTTVIQRKISRFLGDAKARDPLLSEFIEYLRKINDNNDVKAIFGLLYAPIAMELEEPSSMRSGIQTLENPAKSLFKKFLDSKFEELKEKEEKLFKLQKDLRILIKSFENNREKLEIKKTDSDTKAAIERFEKKMIDEEFNLTEQEEKLTEERDRYSFMASTGETITIKDLTNIDENTPEGRSYIMGIYLNSIQVVGLLDVEITGHHSDFIITHLNNLIQYQHKIDFSKLKKISYFDDEGNNKKIIISTDLTKDKEYLGEPNTVTIGLSPWVIREEKTSISSECDRYEIFYYLDGSKYDWEWSEGKRNEKGAEYHPSGSKYYGHWSNGKKHGEGTECYPKGSKYHGEWEEDKKDGRGTYYYPNGSLKYNGQWKNNQPNGEGTLYYPNGSIHYNGQWKDGQPNGKGIVYYPNGSIEYNGQVYYPNGSIEYNGQLKNNQPDGEGIFYYPDGSRYEGEWKGGNQHGKGIFDYPDGSRYEGEWSNDKQNGKGIATYHYSGGLEEYDEEWKNGEKVLSTKRDLGNPGNGIKPESAQQLGGREEDGMEPSK